MEDKQSDPTKTFMRLMFANDRRIYAYIYVLVPNSAEADDLFQDTVTVMWEKFHTFKAGSDFGAWGIGIAYNMVRNYRKKKARSRLVLEEDIEELISDETREALRHLDYRLEALQKCLPRLSREDRNIIELRFENNVPVKKIADKVGCTRKAIYMKLARANSVLLRCIRKTLAEQGLYTL